MAELKNKRTPLYPALMDDRPNLIHRILIIDDNRDIHSDFRKILTPSKSDDFGVTTEEAALFGDEVREIQFPEFQIDSAFQGEEGLELIEKSLQENYPYSMAFVDVRMPPGWDGVETTANIWKKYPELQVVICTAYSDYSWESMLKKLGYSDRLVILKKPFDSIEVLQLAVSMTEKWRLYQQAQLRLSDLEHMVHARTAALQKTNAELAAANDLLTVAREKTQKMAEGALMASKAKSEFLANMSHEIRTPMNGVVGMIDLLLQTPLTVEQHDFADTIRTSADALLTIIDDILDFSKIEAGKMTFEKVDFDLREVITKAVALFAPRAAGKALSYTHLIGDHVPNKLVGDPSRLRQILLNLLGNSVKFTAQGTVSLEVTLLSENAEGSQLKFCISDTGVGISEQSQKTLFQSFTQADTSTTRKFGGTGLGLAICHRLVELMGGNIGVNSTPGKGSTFWFTLRFPKQAPSNQLPNQDVAETKPANNFHPNSMPVVSNGLVILLAEDNKINQMVAVKQLKRLGFVTDVAENGIQAVEMWQRNKYRIILMDCQMPEMDGYKATQQIRGLENEHSLPHTRIIAMTAHAMQGDRELCLAAGMDDYITKPVNVGDLAEILRKVAAETNKDGASISELGGGNHKLLNES